MEFSEPCKLMASVESFNCGRSVGDKRAWNLPAEAISGPFVGFLG